MGTSFFKNTINHIEQNKYLNWKSLIILYILSRLAIVLLFNYGVWNGESILCYTADCKSHWRNVVHVIEGRDPYEEWKKVGGFGLPIPLKAEQPPFLYILMSIFAWFWKSVWAMWFVFILFDFVNLILIYKLARFKKISVLLYIFAPSVIRGLIFFEEEIFVTFALASIYFFKNKKFYLSTIMLALIFNIKFFPIVLFPLLLILIQKKTNNFSILIKQILVFVLSTVFLHIVYFPNWYMFYESRTLHYTLLGKFGIWGLLPTTYYPILLTFAFILFYIVFYFKNFDIRTGYLLGSLIFISLYPKFSLDHFIFLIPLFLVWTELNLLDVIFWILLSIGVIVEFLGLPTIGILNPFYQKLISILMIIGFYLAIANYLMSKDET